MGEEKMSEKETVVKIRIDVDTTEAHRKIDELGARLRELQLGPQFGSYIHARFPPHGEGMWVLVGSSKNPGVVEGLLCNAPIDSPDFHYGQAVKLRLDSKEGWIPA